MKRRLIVILHLLFISAVVFAQTNQFQIDTDHTTFRHRGAIQEVAGTIYAISGNTLLQINELGELEKSVEVKGINKEGGFYIDKIEGGFLVGGLSSEVPRGRLPVVVIEISEDFEQFQQVYLGESVGSVLGLLEGPSMTKTTDGRYLLVDDAFVYEYDSEERQVGYPISHDFERATSILGIGDTIIIGRNRGLNNKNRLMAIDRQGNILWSKISPSTAKLKRLSNGLIGLNIRGVYKLSLQGDIEWQKDFSFMSLTDIIPTKDGGFAVIGTKDNLVTLLKLDETGNIEWEEIYQTGKGTTLLELENGGYALLAEDKQYTYFLKTDESGKIERPLQRKSHEAGLMNVNNVETVFYANGSQFFDEQEIFSNDNANYEVPAKSGKSTMFAGGLWIGGLDEEGKIHLAAQTFFGGQDFQSGPINDSTGFYNNIWSINEKLVNTFKTDLEDGHIDQPIPLDILHYPGLRNPNIVDTKGNPFSIDLPFAPFVDTNADNIYNPNDGDYPDVIGDKMLLWIMNDKKEHEESDALPLEINIYCKAYAYGVPNDEVLNNTLFFEASIHNKSSQDYRDLYIGQWVDFEIGCLEDGDYIGTNEANDFFYAYNGDAKDGNEEGNCSNDFGSASYGEKLPLQTIALLNVPLTSVSHYFNPWNLNEQGMLAPFNSYTYYNTLQGKWIDGSPISIGGLGYDVTKFREEELTTYIFPDNPATQTGWSACTIEAEEQAALISPQVIGSTGPHTLQAGEIMDIAIAYTTFEDVPHPCPNINPIATEIANLKEIYLSGNMDRFTDSLNLIIPKKIINDKEVAAEEEEEEIVLSAEKTNNHNVNRLGFQKGVNSTKGELSISISPNPFQNSLNINITSTESDAVSIVITDILGRRIVVENYNLIKGENQIKISIPSNLLQDGIYFLSAMNSDESLSESFKILHK